MTVGRQGRYLKVKDNQVFDEFQVHKLKMDSKIKLNHKHHSAHISDWDLCLRAKQWHAGYGNDGEIKLQA
jgi:hypothetical protein